MTRYRVDGRTRWHDQGLWLALGAVVVLVFGTWLVEATR